MGVGLQPDKQQRLLFAIDHKQAAGAAPGSGQLRGGHVLGVLTRQLERQRITALAHQAQHQGNHHRFLLGLARSGGGGLANRELQGAGIAIPVALDLQLGCSGLAVPTPELLKIKPGQVASRLGGILHGLHKVLAGGGGAVMTAHIESHATHERLLTQQGVQNADDFCALLVDRRCVEVVDGLVVIRLDRMGRRTGVLAELGVAQQRHVFNALDLGGMQVRREAGIAEDRQALLQRELEPVPAGDAVPRPVVEVLVANDAFDALQLAVGGGLRVR